MTNWTMEELIEYRTKLRKDRRELISGIRWYQSRAVKSIKQKVLDSLDSEMKKVSFEIYTRRKISL